MKNYIRSKLTRSGFTLIEMLACIAIFIIVANLITTIFLKSNEISKIGNKYIYTLREISMIEADITRNIREAEQIIPQLNEYRTSDTAIILRQFKTCEPADDYRYVIYQKNPETDQLTKVTISDYKKTEEVLALTFPAKILSIKILPEEESKRDFKPEFKEIKFTYDCKSPLCAKLVSVCLVPKGLGRRHIKEAIFDFTVKLRKEENITILSPSLWEKHKER